MKPRNLYRIAAVLLVLFAAGHTVGFLGFKPPTAEAMAVRDAMRTVHFQVKSADLSYGGFYNGFGLFVTVYLLFAAFLAWYLSNYPMRVLGWALCGVQVAGVALSWIYFSAAPVVFSALVAGCCGWGASLSPSLSAHGRPLERPSR
jgi:hypothetical protein